MHNESSRMPGLASQIVANGRGKRRAIASNSSDRLPAFVESLAHDLRTPLAVIQEYAALLRDGLVGSLADEQQRVLEVISDRACDLNRVVDNAVDASNFATRSHRVRGHRCRVHDIVARIGPQLVRKAAIRKVDLQFPTSQELPDIHCDDETAGRAVANIICDAINACAKDCKISVSEEPHPRRKEAGMRVSVEGPGQEAVVALFHHLAELSRSDLDHRIDQLREASLAVELIKSNLGTLEAASCERAPAALWVGFPIAEPVEVLQRHLTRISQLLASPQKVMLFRAAVREPIERRLSRDIDRVLNSGLGRNDLVIELDRARWLVAVVHKRPSIESIPKRTQRRRQWINRRRLGEPLPKICWRLLGSWHLPNDLSRMLATVGRRFENRPSADAPA